MKFFSATILLFFLLFTALPTVATLLDWDIQQTQAMMELEEEELAKTEAFKKNIADPFDFEMMHAVAFVSENKTDFSYREPIHSSPYLNIFSPPPEA